MAKGLEEVAQRRGFSAEILAVDESCLYLDKVGSVSGSDRLALHWDDALLDNQYRRFHNGS